MQQLNKLSELILFVVEHSCLVLKSAIFHLHRISDLLESSNSRHDPNSLLYQYVNRNADVPWFITFLTSPPVLVPSAIIFLGVLVYYKITDSEQPMERTISLVRTVDDVVDKFFRAIDEVRDRYHLDEVRACALTYQIEIAGHMELNTCICESILIVIIIISCTRRIRKSTQALIFG